MSRLLPSISSRHRDLRFDLLVIGCSGVKILYTTREANVLKFTKNYNNESDSSNFL